MEEASRLHPGPLFDLWFAEAGNNFAGRVQLRGGRWLLDESWSDREAELQLRSADWSAWRNFAPFDEDAEGEKQSE